MCTWRIEIMPVNFDVKESYNDHDVRPSEYLTEYCS